MSKKYTHLLFDWDGTIANTLNIWVTAYKDLFKQYGILVSNAEIVDKAFGNIYGSKNFGILDHLKFNNELFALAKSNYHKASLYSNVKHVLRKLHDKRIDMAIITSTQECMIRDALDFNGLTNVFILVIARDACSELKPSPLPVYKAIRKIDSDSNNYLMIGDSDKDIVAGKNAGIDTLLFYPLENNSIYSDKVIQSFIDLKPTYIINDFIDLLNFV